MTRRTFLGYTLAAGSLTAFSSEQITKAQTISPSGMPYSILGRTGMKVSRLGIGCAHLGRDPVTQDEVNRVVHRAIELGITYLDTAPVYGKSEERLGIALKGIRDKIFLATKTEETTYEGTWKVLRQSLNRLQTDHLDLVYIHNFGNEERFRDIDLVLGDKGVLGALREAKQKGIIRFIGTSGHLYPTRFHKVLDTGEIDILMNAVNFIEQHTYDFENKVWARAHMENVGLVAMKVLGGMESKGLNARIPKKYYHQAIRYALSLPGVCCANIGVNTVTEVEENVKVVNNLKPLSPEESYEISKIGLELAHTAEWAKVYGEPLT